MKIGFVLECTAGGADMQICGWIAQQRCPGFLPTDPTQFRTMTNKAALMEGCGDEAAALLAGGCQHVFVVWDLRPAWPNDDALDCVRECEMVRAKLNAARVPEAKATCVCITKELEVWLLADTEALRKFCGPPEHPKARIPKQGRLEHIDWPKDRVEKLCQIRGRKFVASVHALQILKAARREKLRKVHSYARFEDKLAALLRPH